ncbi:acetoacetate--CoA ligase [Gammaproteobacteria bacterium LSUCC0112]|nr:acetoacetate--CoA ligase [Gammaproteobacteria bacterium LSUCC0112]
MQLPRFSLSSGHAHRMGACQLVDFARWLRATRQLRFESYEALHQWSVTDREAFWQACLDFCGIQLLEEPDPLLTPAPVLSRGEHLWLDRWFPGTRLNYAQNLLKFDDDHTALIFCDELGHRDTLSYAELTRKVAHLAAWLKTQGIKPGDRIAGFAANRIETVVAMLAATSLGAIWSSCSPDFGVGGILDRFTQIEPTILFAVPAHCYAGKVIQHQATLEKLMAGLPSLHALVLMPDLYTLAVPDTKPVAPTDQCEVYQWAQLPGLSAGFNSPPLATPALDFYAAAFSDPLFIMYSSGTTGVPKCIVHGVGGTLLQHRKEHQLHLNLKRDDVLFYFTTCGWMMWNWLVSGLASGATLVLYDGSPFHPAPDILFSIAAETGVSIFGTSAKYLAAVEKAGVKLHGQHAVHQLHTVLSTGSPLSAEGFDYVYRDIKANVMLQSISGGTDIISCFVLGNPVQPIYRGEIQCAGLGMDVAVYNNQGQAVRGEKGELVCRQSFPSMPVGFWRDSGHQKYRAAYFDRYDGCWTHGDYAELTDHNGWIIYGRSDTVLNPGGVRIGTAEIYRQVEQLPWVLESVAIAQAWQADVRVVLFVRLRGDLLLNESLRGEIRQQIRSGASPRHVPAVIEQVQDIPRTLNGKIAEIAVRETIHSRPVNNKDALANPGSLQEYEALAARLSPVTDPRV